MVHTVKFIYASVSALPGGMLYCQIALPRCQAPMTASTWGSDILWGSMSPLHLRTSPFSIRCDYHGPALLRARSCQVPAANCTHTKDVQLLGRASFAPAAHSERSPHWLSTVVISTTSSITTSQMKPHQIVCNYPLIDVIFCAEKPSSTKCSRSCSSLPRGCLLVWFSSGMMSLFCQNGRSSHSSGNDVPELAGAAVMKMKEVRGGWCGHLVKEPEPRTRSLRSLLQGVGFHLWMR